MNQDFVTRLKDTFYYASEAAYRGYYVGDSERKSHDRIQDYLRNESDLRYNRILGSNRDMFALETDKGIIFSFRGTEPNNSRSFLRDVIVNDAQIALGERPNRVRQASAFVNNIVRQYGEGKQIFLTGHSLGGFIAETISVYTGFTAITFNAPGRPLSLRYRQAYPVEFEHSDKIFSFKIRNDFVGSFGLSIGTTIFQDGPANGSTHPLTNFAPQR